MALLLKELPICKTKHPVGGIGKAFRQGTLLYPDRTILVVFTHRHGTVALSENIDNVTYKLLSHDGTITVVTGSNFQVPKQGLAEGTLFIDIPKKELGDDKIKLKIGVFSGEKLIETTTTNFLGPRSYR